MLSEELEQAYRRPQARRAGRILSVLAGVSGWSLTEACFVAKAY